MAVDAHLEKTNETKKEFKTSSPLYKALGSQINKKEMSCLGN
jgi:hypothetical protein